MGFVSIYPEMLSLTNCPKFCFFTACVVITKKIGPPSIKLSKALELRLNFQIGIVIVEIRAACTCAMSHCSTTTQESQPISLRFRPYSSVWL